MQRTVPVTGLRTALLHQRAPVPAVNGVSKPMKPGGYADGCADIAYALRSAGETIITPVSQPDPVKDLDWSFPDTVSGVREAVERGANVLWANTNLHSLHAIVEIQDELIQKGIRLFGQNPLLVEKYDDKEWANRWLAKQKGLETSFPKSMLYRTGDQGEAGNFPLPAMAKPVRGRGSHGVTKVSTAEELMMALDKLLKESDAVLLEEYLDGEEITITVMPPGDYTKDYWALPVVYRFDQIDGVMPWNGTVPVTENSRVITPEESDADRAYSDTQAKCVLVAQLLEATAPIRIDCRRLSEGGPFVLFDVNVKPNAGGPGRPGRDGQAALTTMSAEAIGWDWPEFAVNLLRTAQPLAAVLSHGK
ncbi:hypothetical protein I302_100997 [Kwoniella bestiolae CBS 10118]|uniref:ATP-grasp domain-containing protein n=1 Tax=Kwoniella bestiolae CBS 10118 TaxID=1296100 RepID=A0A1B9G6M4_9TREE|nr:hypothetical protein I302_04374 [Kwoniella bestiolae CBS 10118]OCF26687.1 hypothetical protein I302_04374 [Kwoniella bestiolae CBS 10118]